MLIANVSKTLANLRPNDNKMLLKLAIVAQSKKGAGLWKGHPEILKRTSSQIYELTKEGYRGRVLIIHV